MTGTVYLVGAGPGDPGLLTVRALELLERADVVLHDALVSDAILQHVGPGAERMCIGRRGLEAPRSAEPIHPEVLAHARAGRQVVRLKQGDPLVFGRGGEEAAALRAAGIPFEIVPGISAALGAAASAGIPLTQRGLSSDVTFATGHDLLTGAPGAVEWAALARGTGTLVLYMGRRRLAENVARLIACGRAPQTPAALVASATTARERVVTAPLAELPARAGDVGLDEPSLLVVGEVVAARAPWRERLPLAGRRILVARARPGPSQIARALAGRGAEVLEAPRLAVAPVADARPLDAALDRFAAFDAVVFGCAPGVRALVERLGALGRDLRRLPPVPLWAVGEAAAAALVAAGLPPERTTPGACEEALRALGPGRLLLVSGDGGRPRLRASLAASGAKVVEVCAYALAAAHPPPLRLPPDLVVLPSSSAAERLYGPPFGRALLDVPALALGPSTEAAARRLGATRVRRTATDTPAAAVDAACEAAS